MHILRRNDGMYLEVYEGSFRSLQKGWWENERSMVVEGGIERENQGETGGIQGIRYRGIDEEKEIHKARYKVANREAKRAFTIAKNNRYGRLYLKLKYGNGGKEVFKLARKRRTRDLSSVRCIKDYDF